MTSFEEASFAFGGPRSGRSGPITVTLELDGYGTPDEEPEWFVIERIEGETSDANWFDEMWKDCGKWLLDRDLWNAKRLVIVGHCWWSRSSTPDGDDYDGGFEIDEIKEIVK